MATDWTRLVGWVVVLVVTAGLFTFVAGREPRPSDWWSDQQLGMVFGAFFLARAAYAMRLGFIRPRITVGPEGIVDHTTGRGLMSWSDFSGVAVSRGFVRFWRLPQLRLFASREACRRYNQRMPTWRRFLDIRLVWRQSIEIPVVGLDHNLRWLEAEIGRRING